MILQARAVIYMRTILAKPTSSTSNLVKVRDNAHALSSPTWPRLAWQVAQATKSERDYCTRAAQAHSCTKTDVALWANHDGRPHLLSRLAEIKCCVGTLITTGMHIFNPTSPHLSTPSAYRITAYLSRA